MSSSSAAKADPSLVALRDDVEKMRKLYDEVSTDVGREALRTAIASCERHHAMKVQHREQQDRQDRLAEQQRLVDEANANPTGRSATLRRWNISAVRPGSPFEAVVLAAHCMVLDYGFVALEEMKSSTPGFAPPIRELPTIKLIADAWCSATRASPPSCTLMYKQLSSKKRFVLSFALAPESQTVIRVSLGEKNGEAHTTTVDMALQVRQDASGADTAEALFANLSDLEGTVRSLLASCGVMPQLAAAAAEASSMDTDTSGAIGVFSEPGMASRRSGQGGQGQDPHGLRPIFAEAEPRINPRIDPRVGTGDLNPFAPSDPRGSQPFGPGSGSLVGPDHPIFGIPPQPRDPGYPNLPQPRFDPYGPVTGPHGPDVGNVGYDPRYPPGAGGGRGAAGGRGRVPGEPDPDHLKPPDLPDLEDRSPFAFPGGAMGPGRGRGRGRGPNDNNNPFFR